jgi:DNA-binding transcriptional ArsR family regulator
MTSTGATMTSNRIPKSLVDAWAATEPAADETDEPTNGTRTRAKGPGKNHQAKDRFRSLNDFCDVTLCELSRNEIAVWLLLWRDERDGTTRTSQADLAKRAGVSDRTIRRTLASLERRGLLKVSFRGGIRRGCSVYRIRPLPPKR